jgi:hypothetical protein
MVCLTDINVYCMKIYWLTGNKYYWLLKTGYYHIIIIIIMYTQSVTSRHVVFWKPNVNANIWENRRKFGTSYNIDIYYYYYYYYSI